MLGREVENPVELDTYNMRMTKYVDLSLSFLQQSHVCRLASPRRCPQQLLLIHFH